MKEINFSPLEATGCQRSLVRGKVLHILEFWLPCPLAGLLHAVTASVSLSVRVMANTVSLQIAAISGSYNLSALSSAMIP